MADISKIKLPNDNTIYDIRDKATHVELTQAAYEALEQAGEVIPNKVYFIKDANGTVVAQYVRYSNITSGLSATNVQAAIDEIVEDKADRVPLPAEYDATSTYNRGDLVVYNDVIYVCKSTISTPEAWNDTHWLNLNTTYDTDYLHSINPTGIGTFSLNRKASTTIGLYSFAEGYDTTASGFSSHAEGYSTAAGAVGSHAEGYFTEATGSSGAHAEGNFTTASGNNSHAEGQDTAASEDASHAEGYHTTASGKSSHAEGTYTTANHKSQHVFGEYNVLDDSTAQSTAKGNYVEIVGNGTGTSARSNARTLDWSGNEVLAGGLKLNGNLNVSPTIKMTQAEYDAIVDFTPYANTHIVITDAPNLNPTASDIEYSSGVTVADKINNLAIGDLSNNLEIGKIIKGTESGSVNVASASGTEVGSITLNKGKYVILGGIDWAANSSGTRQVAFNANKDPSRDASVCQPACASPKETYQQIVSFRDIQTDNTTIKLYGWQDSGSTLGAYAFIYAIKIY